jgi:hypothetical protein
LGIIHRRGKELGSTTRRFIELLQSEGQHTLHEPSVAEGESPASTYPLNGHGNENGNGNGHAANGHGAAEHLDNRSATAGAFRSQASRRARAK